MKLALAAVAFALALCIGIKAEAATIQTWHFDYDFGRPAEYPEWFAAVSVHPISSEPVPCFCGADRIISETFVITSDGRSARDQLFFRGGETSASLDISVVMFCQDPLACPAIMLPEFTVNAAGIPFTLRAALTATPLPGALVLFLGGIVVMGGMARRRQCSRR